MPAPEHLLADVHELRDAVRAVARELVQLEGDEADRLAAVQREAAREAALRELPDGGDEELVLESDQRGGNGGR
jgi:hypothetical protein